MIFQLSKNQKRELWVIFFYCTYAFVNDTTFLGYVSDKIPNSGKYFLGFFTLVEFLFFSAFVKQVINNKKLKKGISIIAALFCLFLVLYFITVPWKQFDSVPVGVESILVIILSVYYLFEQINKPETLFIYSTSTFWIVFGFMLCLSGSFFIFLYANSVPLDEMKRFWFIIYILNILRNIFITVGIIIDNDKTGQSKSLKSHYRLF